MKSAIEETSRRRRIQQEYNEANGITPQSISKPIDMTLVQIAAADYVEIPFEAEEPAVPLDPEQKRQLIASLEEKMKEAARNFAFEKAAQYRDRIKGLKSTEP
jgi:excinuclease ABC subunit B